MIFNTVEGSVLKIKFSLAVTLRYVVNEPFHSCVHSNTVNLSCIF